jgi:L-seryl-tRNA(Ser) seleniumtransferase
MNQDSMQQSLRRIPAVDQLLIRPLASRWVLQTSRAFVVSEIQQLLQEVRRSIRSGDAGSDAMADPGSLDMALDERLQLRLRPVLRTVINATGVILHTNLGRAPLSAAAQECLSAVSSHYTNLEYDLRSGERSRRDRLVEAALAELLGCEAALVVNNNAAAIFLILNTLAAGREVIVSRGELIEIGGAFRIPDIMTRSGAVLREVGTTNRTRIEDYEAAIRPETALLLRVHPSNYRIRGFTERPELAEMVKLARRCRLPLVEDIGSGCLLDLRPFGIQDEPVAQDSLRAGVDLVCFSGDKILGGPQSGVIAGARPWIESLGKNPLLRTFRVEKLIYGALEATLASYRTGRHLEEIPVLRMISLTPVDLKNRAQRFARQLRKRVPAEILIGLFKGKSVVGGGSCPDCDLPTTLVGIESGSHSPGDIESRLRSQDPPVIIRVEENRPLVDLRTVFPEQETALLAALTQSLKD